MREQFEAELSSPEGKIDGIVHQMNDDASAWEFKSIDGTLHLVIDKDRRGNWQRIAGTDPYLSGWVDELGAHIKSHK